ncbi:MAG: GTP 3',8-cyclase MoaA [Romboutsia sp.]
MIDKFGRNINYLRISLTHRCNLRCMYCIPEDIKFDKNNEYMSLNDYKFIIKSMSELGITKVRFTGGEPLLYPYLEEIIRFTKEECNIEDIAITTNGILLHEMIHSLKDCGLKKVNISLDSLKEYKYKNITRGGTLKDVLKSINTCLRLGLEVKVNCVSINEFNDDEIYDFILMTNYYPIDIRFIELMPIGEAKKLYKRGYLDIRAIIENIDEMYRVDSGEESSAVYYKFNGAKGRVGVISPISRSFCDDCNKIRVTSKGTIKLCLHSMEEIDIKSYLQKPLIFRETMKDLILDKPKEHYLGERQSSDTQRSMCEIGG